MLWFPMETAPKDGSEIVLRIVHPFQRYELRDKALWEQEVIAQWIDHNGGGWTWHGMYGRPQGWRRLVPVTMRERRSGK